jgi:hypothetical protein
MCIEMNLQVYNSKIVSFKTKQISYRAFTKRQTTENTKQLCN